jgi:ABC-type Fe2+-enterobactin transport system substrate-binding protein
VHAATRNDNASRLFNTSQGTTTLGAPQRTHSTMAVTLYGMLIGIISLSIQYATALQLNLDDHGCIHKFVRLLD